MAAGNRHLGYKEVLNALEDRSPGTKAAFLFGFLERGHERFAADAGERARRAAARVHRVRCADTRRRLRVLPARVSRRRVGCPVDAREVADVARPFAAGDRVLLVDAKRRRHLITLAEGGEFHTHAGRARARRRSSAADEGSTVRTTLRRAPRRGAADARRVRARDAARRAGDLPEGPRADPHARRRLPGRAGARVGRRLRRAHDHAAARGRARPVTSPATRSATTSPGARARNVEGFLGPDVPLDVEVRDVYDGIDVDDLDRILLDLPEPWRVVKHAEQALHPGGILLAYLPTIGQVARLREELGGVGVRHGRDRSRCCSAPGTSTASRCAPTTGWWRTPASSPTRGCSRPGGVNFLDLARRSRSRPAAGWVGYRLGFVRRVASWAGLAGRRRRRGRCSSTTSPTRCAAHRPRTRLLGVARVRAARRDHRPGGRRTRSAARCAHALGRHAGAAMRRATASPARCVGVAGVLVLMWLLIPALASSPGWTGTRGARLVRSRALHRPRRARPAVRRRRRSAGWSATQPFPEVFDTLTSPDAGDAAAATAFPPRLAARVAQLGRAGRRPGVRPRPGRHRASSPRPTSSSPTRTSSRGSAHRRSSRDDGRRLDADGRRVRSRTATSRSCASPGSACPPLAAGDGHVDDRRRGLRPSRRWSAAPGAGADRRADRRPRHRHLPHAADRPRACSCSPPSPHPATPARPVVDAERQGRRRRCSPSTSAAATTAYALTRTELDAVLEPVLAGTAPPSPGTGECLAE